jgi:adenine-specific DNA-methyltransferase
MLCLDNIIWKKRYGGGAKEKHLVTIHDYVLVYAKFLEEVSNIYVPLSDEAVERYYTLRDENFEKRGPFRTHPFESMKSFEERENLRFAIRAPDGTMVMPKRQWRWSKARVDQAQAQGALHFSRNRDGNWMISSKPYLKDEGEQRETKSFTIIDDIYSQHTTNEIVSLFGYARVFPFPKPTKLIQKILDLGTSRNEKAIVLDFFAGSGTTGHAVMAQNAADNGNRRYVLVQLPEPLDLNSREQRGGGRVLQKKRTAAETLGDYKRATETRGFKGQGRADTF